MTPNEAAAADFLDDLPGEVTVDAALRALVLGLACAVDADPTNAALWREYRAALATIREAANDVDDDDTAAFLLTVSSARRATVRDPANS